MIDFSAGLDAEGLLAGVDFVPSPNRDGRPPETEVSLVVIHAISLPPGQFGGDGILQLFTNGVDPNEHPYYRSLIDLRVSAHFLVRRDGRIVQFVPCGMRAWHAGVSSWSGRERCNDFSIGIELEGCDDAPFETPQYERLAQLIDVLARRYPLRDIVGHSDIAPGRKTDPGPCFEWPQLHALLMKSSASHVVTAQR